MERNGTTFADYPCAGGLTEAERPAYPWPVALEVRDLRLAYGSTQVLRRVDLAFPANRATALIGPSGCGKTTLLRCLNRLHETSGAAQVEGNVVLEGESIWNQDPVLLRRRVGMVFQKPNPFPMSIWDNVLYGVKAGGGDFGPAEEVVESSLRQAALWDEVKDRLKDSAFALSLGQQQRLCIARALAISPEIVLMDEPTASLDPISTERLEDSILAMKGRYTVILVTHDMHQANRVADYTALMMFGELIEWGPTKKLFEAPDREETREYLAGRIVTQRKPEQDRRATFPFGAWET